MNIEYRPASLAIIRGQSLPLPLRPLVIYQIHMLGQLSTLLGRFAINHDLVVLLASTCLNLIFHIIPSPLVLRL
jgi:hypothetical protein